MLRIAVAATLVLAVAACGGPPSPSEYFDQMNRIGAQQDAATRSILPPGVAPTRDAITDLVNVRKTGLQEAEAIVPPAAIEIEHLAFVGTLRFYVELADEFLHETENLDAQSFHDALLASTDIDNAARLFSEACAALEASATRLGVEGADLRC